MLFAGGKPLLIWARIRAADDTCAGDLVGSRVPPRFEVRRPHVERHEVVAEDRFEPASRLRRRENPTRGYSARDRRRNSSAWPPRPRRLSTVSLVWITSIDDKLSAMEVDLLTVGDAFEELIFFGLSRLPRPGEELTTQNLARSFGGGAVLTGLAAARSGAIRCRVATALSSWAQRLLRGKGLIVSNLREPREPHAVTVALSTAGERSFVTFRGGNDALEPRYLRMIARPRARHVHFAFQPRRCRAWLRPMAELRERGVTTSWDFGYSDRLAGAAGLVELAGAVDFVSFNEREARLYSGASTLARATTFWRQRTRHTILKLGARGAQLLVPDGTLSAAAERIKVVETTGAGDAFNGGFLRGLLLGQPLAACLRTGIAASAASIRAPGGAVGLGKRVRV